MSKMMVLSLLVFLHLRNRVLSNQLTAFQQYSDQDLEALERLSRLAMDLELDESPCPEFASQLLRVASMLVQEAVLPVDESVMSDMLWFAAQHNHTEFVRRVLEDADIHHTDVVQAYMESQSGSSSGLATRKASLQPEALKRRRRSSCRRSFSYGPVKAVPGCL